MRRRIGPQRLGLTLLLGAVLAVPIMALEVPRDDAYAESRREMVERQIASRGVTDANLLQTMAEVPRHMFVPETLRDQAYVDNPLPIGDGQTISQPYIVALMTSLLELDGDERILEVGTGSGYQAAVLSRMAREVYSIEIREPLARRAESSLAELGYDNIMVRVGDGHQGWPEAAPFDGILVTAAPEKIPEKLIDQLVVGGKMVIPVGKYFQDLMVLTRTADGVEKRKVTAVRFVPMIGDAEEPR